MRAGVAFTWFKNGYKTRVLTVNSAFIPILPEKIAFLKFRFANIFMSRPKNSRLVCG